MGRLEANPVPLSSDQTPVQPPPQGYPNHHDNPLSSPPPPPPPPPPPSDAYVTDNIQNTNSPLSTRSYVPQPTEQPPPPHQSPASYPPHLSPASYPPQQSPASYPPPPQHAAYPPETYQPQPQPTSFPPLHQPTNYPPQEQHAAYPPQEQPVAYPSQQPSAAYSSQQPTSCNVQPQVVNYGGTIGYQTPVPMGTPNGIPIGAQYLAPTQGWSTGLLDCMEDPENAIMTLCFPCVTFGQIAEIVDNGQTSCATSGLIYGLIAAFIGIPCIMSCSYRTKIRSRYGLMETPAPDWAIHFFCEYCALCQEYRELKSHGMDPAIGWQGNMSRNQQMAKYQTMTPPMNQTMMG
ncbi:protein PLANT CADMIUM RESISTANCE 4-like [Cynara cardunculus var. scolymus]|uniref:PLAC8 motif-containing protein n=1 Tax=Cynara cardunculus var. scolymus TaxID=59895 RepID=A0A103Y8J3_CYNCS|nr:protein PLANT CADMIUM RESISTANCE 4-like [Cynara cardunculus var. scolymus]KVI04492.1 hypothetical protein Ccrd_017191 [Cynara cardunculus var. scolymus]